MTTNRNRRKRRSGFSLIEVTLVIAIIGVLAALAAYNLVGVGERARRKATVANMGTVRTAINMYHANYSGQYPPSLAALMTGPNSFLDPEKGILDGWGREFIYDPTPAGGKPFQLISLGGDGIFGTEDDLNIWTPPRD
jgi:general secretion pathway protein G